MQTDTIAGPPARAAELPNLDIMRAVAVGAVFFDHLLFAQGYRAWGPFSIDALGRAGVLMFFVHTSLVLMMSMDRTGGASGRRLYGTFLVRRFFRIYPLSVFTVCAVTLLRIPPFADGAAYVWAGWKHLLANLALVQNITLSPQFTGPLWSLPFEVQMYCVLPAIYLVVRRRPASALYLFATVAMTAPALFCAGEWLRSNGVRGLSTLQFFPCFFSGILAYHLRGRTRPRWRPSLWVALLAVLVCGYCVSRHYAAGSRLPALGPDFSEMACGWILCAVLGAAIPLFQQNGCRRLNRCANLVARYSYGIYLSHMAIFWLCFVRLAAAPAYVQWTLAAALSASVPVALYHWIEQPGIQLGKRIAGRSLFVTVRRGRNVAAGPLAFTAFGAEFPARVQRVWSTRRTGARNDLPTIGRC